MLLLPALGAVVVVLAVGAVRWAERSADREERPRASGVHGAWWRSLGASHLARRGSARFAARVALLVGATAAALVVGVTTANAPGRFGPHEARYEVTADSTVTVDVGPLGTVQVDSPLPLGLGARVEVAEIPAGAGPLAGDDTLGALSADVREYAQLFGAPEAAVHDAVRALAADAARRTGLVLVVLIGGWFAGRRLVGAARIAELADVLRRTQVRAAAAGAAAALLLVAGVSTTAHARPRPAGATASAVFDGTPLEGARITGRLGGLVDTYGGMAVAAYRENQQFYARADRSLTAAWDGWADDHPASGDRAGTQTTVLVVSDLHCNVGMARIITTLTRLSGAQVVLDAGDTVMNGSGIERYCATTFADAVPDGVDLVTAPGNHDSPETTAAYADAGALVLDGEVVEVDGMRLLGAPDPRQDRLLAEPTQSESHASVGERLGRVACADPEGVDLVLFHNPRVAPTLMADGCVPALVSGHMHTRTDPEQVGHGIRYVSGSTAGAQENASRLGPLKGTAELTVLHWDPRTRRITDWQLVEIGTDARATVGERRPWPLPMPWTIATPDQGGP
ncbi:metallophosphoesterase family protein [Cellulomonas hominis]|uniref:metallophosphoesterase family protein n=1 Tax=Cellulomonas hominis TaxID=156981 RepID=UPI0020BFE0B0|nr:metallophosphoesterase [Cellulomonas hominis]